MTDPITPIDPHVLRNGKRVSLRFALPKIAFSEATIAAYEEQCSISYLMVLEQVLNVDNIPEGETAAEKALAKKKMERAESTAQGMLFYLANLWSSRSRVGAVRPPINSSMVTWWRRNYPFFDETVADFEEELSDAAEEELYSRAVLGVETPLVINGAVEYVTKKSDDLLKYFLTHNRPKRYSQKIETKVEQKTELSGGVRLGVDRSSLAHLSDEELDALEALLLKGTT